MATPDPEQMPDHMHVEQEAQAAQEAAEQGRAAAAQARNNQAIVDAVVRMADIRSSDNKGLFQSALECMQDTANLVSVVHADEQQVAALKQVMADMAGLTQKTRARQAMLDSLETDITAEPEMNVKVWYHKKLKQAQAQEARAPQGGVLQDSEEAGISKEFARGASGEAEGEEDSEDDMLSERDREQMLKCKLTLDWLEDPVTPAGCPEGGRHVFSRVAAVDHFKKGPMRGHRQVTCPYPGCTGTIKALDELKPRKDIAKKVAKAKRKKSSRNSSGGGGDVRDLT